MAEIKRIPLRVEVRDAVAKLLWDGVWSPGDDLNEAALAAELGVSRTPLREGLLILASEGLIEAKPNRGFHVPAVNEEAVVDLYPVLGALEALAVRRMKDDPAMVGKELLRMNLRLEKDGLSRAKRYEIDAAFHAKLAEASGNKALQSELKNLWSRSRSIDGALLRGMADVENSSADHHDIAKAIGSGDLEGAAVLVERHWLGGIDVVKKWIRDAMPDPVCATQSEKDSRRA